MYKYIKQNTSPWILKTIAILFVIEIAYLLLINIALGLPMTQSLINKIKPEKFHVSWESARSWYPFRVHAVGVSANGQTRKQQWQMDSPEVSASINLIPLLWKSVKLSDLDVTDAIFHFRPRPREDKDYSKIRPFFAPIDNRILETEPPELEPLKERKPWDISIEDIQATGMHRIWVYQMQLDFDGELATDIDVQTRGGPFSLDNGVLDVNISSLVLNGDREVLRNGRISGVLEFAPFRPKENKGIKALGYLSAELDLNAETDSLAFLNIYLDGFQGMKVAGKGELDGHLNYQQGKLNAQSQLSITASELAVDMLDYRAQGEGEIDLEVNSDMPDELRFNIDFGELDGVHADTGDVLFTGDGLTFEGIGSTQILPGDDEQLQATRLTASIPLVKVPDLGVFQRFMSPFRSLVLHSGEGELQGEAEITQTGVTGNLSLSSKQADIGIQDYHFTADLDMGLDIDAPDVVESGVDVSGTYMSISDARLSSEEAGSSSPWAASVEVLQGKLKLLFPDEGITNKTRLRDLLPVIEERGLQHMLDSNHEQVKARGMVSDLRWLNVLLKNKLDMKFQGAGNVTADLVLDSGWLAPGSEINITPENIIVDVLDYTAAGQGDGHMKLIIKKGGENPDVSLDLKMANASLKSKGDEAAFVEGTDILFHVDARNMSYTGPGEDIDLHLQIPSARVTDMSVYNQYLPPNSPLRIIDGQAELQADVMLEPENADGYVKLVSSGIKASVDEQEVAADLVADIKLVGGVPRDMEFDITGSSIHIRDVVVSGDEKSHDNDKWGVILALNEARAKWKKPIELDLKASIDMTDSRPFVAMMANHKGKHGWLGKALTVEDVTGEATMTVKDETLVIPLVYVSSEKIGVGAKGLINADMREGIVYVRFKKLDGILKMRNGDHNLDILRAREKFDQYLPDNNTFD